MKAEIICIGNELLNGHTVDTNSCYISQKLLNIGIEIQKKTIIGDNLEAIKKAVFKAFQSVEIIIITGGLGSTDDDITRQAIASALNKQLVLNSKILHKLEEHFKKQNQIILPSISLQALIPQNSFPIENKIGTACGIYIPYQGKDVFSIPGVPAEMKAMVDNFIIPTLTEKYGKKQTIGSKLLRTCGLSEIELNERLKNLIKRDFTLAYLPHFGYVDIRITACGNSPEAIEKILENTTYEITQLLGDYLYGTNNTTLEEVVGSLLLIQNKSLSVAESCTGGLIAKKITDIAGSSKYFKGAIIAYSNEAKIKILGVSSSIITKFGAVNEETAIAMASQIRKLKETNIGLAVTGIAGPTGSTKTKPIGLVYIALDNEGKVECKKYNFSGSRNIIREKTSIYALNMIRCSLL